MQQPIYIIITILFVFTIISILFIVATLAFRIINVQKTKKMNRLNSYYSELFFSYLDDSSNRELKKIFHKIKDKEGFFSFLLHYLEVLEGREKKLILELIGDIRITEMLTGNLSHKNKWKRAYAAYYLGFLNYNGALPALLKAMNDPFYLVQFYAARTIIQLKITKYLKGAIEKLFSISQLSSYQIMEGLIELDDSGLEICKQMVIDKKETDEERLRIFVDLFAYKRYPEASEQIALIFVDAESRELKISCIRAMGLLHYKPAVELLRSLVKTDDWIIRSQVMRTLGRIGDIGSIPEFTESLKSENFWIRYNGALALFELGTVGITQLKKISKFEAHPGREIVQQILTEKKDFIS